MDKIMDNKKIIGIIIVFVAIVVIYLLLRKKSTDKLAKEGTEANTNLYSNLLSGNVSAREELSAEDFEYNELVNEYKQKYRKSPDESWSAEQIRARIAEYDEIQAEIKKYYMLEAEYDEGNVVKTSSELAKMSLTELITLNSQVEAQNKRAKWNQRKSYLHQLVNAFKENMTAYGTWYGDCKGYDTATFDALSALPQNEKVYANYYFGTLGGVNVGANWLDYTKHPTLAKTISGAIPKIGESVDRDRADRSQVGKMAAMSSSKKIKEAYASIKGSVNEYGEIV